MMLNVDVLRTMLTLRVLSERDTHLIIALQRQALCRFKLEFVDKSSNLNGLSCCMPKSNVC